jgi:uncharacterized protein
LSIRFALFLIIICANFLAYRILCLGAAPWMGRRAPRRAGWIGLFLLIVNLPLLAFFIPPADALLIRVPRALLWIFFYPSAAWMATLMALVLVAFAALPGILAWRSIEGVAGWIRKLGRRASAPPGEPFGPAASVAPSHSLPAGTNGVSRRNLLARVPGLFLAGIYGTAAYGVYSKMDEIDVSKEQYIPILHLPRSLDGLTVVQISDLHVGPYIRERELRHAVNLVNELHPDLVVITGDVLDRHLSSLPDAVRGLQGIRAGLGTFAVLGNHDYYADRFSSSALYRGGIRIAKGLESIGIRTLRNEVANIGTGADQLALMGLDWLTSGPTDRNFFRYKPVETRRQLKRMMQESGPEIPRILLAHHPDTFQDVPPEIGLTLSGHTHGGGQVILGSFDGIPIGIATLRFKYLSGLYQKNGSSLYVNRGIGYLGIPIRINCPPEISHFRLVRPAAPKV